MTRQRKHQIWIDITSFDDINWNIKFYVAIIAQDHQREFDDSVYLVSLKTNEFTLVYRFPLARADIARACLSHLSEMGYIEEDTPYGGKAYLKSADKED